MVECVEHQDSVAHDRGTLTLTVQAFVELVVEFETPVEAEPHERVTSLLQPIDPVTHRIVRDEHLTLGIPDQELVSWSTINEVVDMRFSLRFLFLTDSLFP